MDFHTFVAQRRDALRAAFGWATYFGLDPDDITQDTLMRAHRRYRRFRCDDELFKWCVKVGHNMIRKQRGDALRRWRQLHPEPHSVAVVSEHVDAEAVAVANADLDRFLATLRPRYAQVLRMDAGGFTREEMADALHVSTSAVGMLLHRARKAARDGWGQIVAACAWVVARVRHTVESATTGGPAQSAMIAATVSLSMVAALAVPRIVHDGPRSEPVGPIVALDRDQDTSGAGRSAPPGAAPQPRATRPNKSAIVLAKAERKRPVPGKVPHVPENCAQGVCVGSCPDPDNTAGDRIYLKPLGPCQVRVAEQVTPLCEDVPENPVVGCERREPDDWLIDDPMPTTPEGDAP